MEGPERNLFTLEGETALVTGATRGIGRIMALALAQAGAKVLLAQASLPKSTWKIMFELTGSKARHFRHHVKGRNQRPCPTRKVVNHL